MHYRLTSSNIIDSSMQLILDNLWQHVQCFIRLLSMFHNTTAISAVTDRMRHKAPEVDTPVSFGY
jgi:adenylosuccinate lyase